MDLVLCFPPLDAAASCSVDSLLLMLTQHLEQELSSLLFLFYNVTLLWVDKLFLSVTELKGRKEKIKNKIKGKTFSCKTVFRGAISSLLSLYYYEFFFFLVNPLVSFSLSLSDLLFFCQRWWLQQQQKIAWGGRLYGHFPQGGKSFYMTGRKKWETTSQKKKKKKPLSYHQQPCE